MGKVKQAEKWNWSNYSNDWNMMKVEMSGMGEARDIRQKMWIGITVEKNWTCNQYQMGGRDKNCGKV